MNLQQSTGTPISSQGLVKVNGCINKVSIRMRMYPPKLGPANSVLYPIGREGSDFSATKHEPAFIILDHSTGLVTPRGVMPQLQVNTSLNGLAFKGEVSDALTEEDLRRLTRERIRFVGINDTNWDATKPDETSNHAAITVAGSVTVANTSDKPIHIGDTIVWDLPPLERLGNAVSARGSSKRLLMLRPIKDMRSILTRVEPPTARIPSAEEYLKVVRELNTQHSEERSRIIGKALTAAQPNQHFDLLLGYAHG